jgi:hypothetical protein
VGWHHPDGFLDRLHPVLVELGGVLEREPAARERHRAPVHAPTTGETLAGSTFQGRHELPRFARAKYQELMHEWWQTDPAWSSDEHEFCVWLVAAHRDFFSSEIPHMGYVQFLVEGDAQALRVGGLTIRLNAGMSAVQSLPRAELRPNADEKWFFDLSRIGK